MLTLENAQKFEFVGANLALDFCNTVGGKRGETTSEKLNSIVDYLAWCHQAGLLDEWQAQACLNRAERHPAEAGKVLGRATALREAIFRVLQAYLEEGIPAPQDLGLLNSELSEALGRLRLKPAPDADCLTWRWAIVGGELDHPLGPIAHAAAGLLTEVTALERLHMCNGDNCGWLFLDSSRNHSRRWCAMRDCGNRAKIRRHRLKQQT